MADVSFHNAYIVILPLSIQVIAQYLTWYLNFSFLISEHTGEALKNSLFKAVVTTALAVILIPAYGFVGAAWALAIAGLLTAQYCLYRGRKFYDMGISSFVLYGMILAFALLFLAYEWLVPEPVSLLTDIALRSAASTLVGVMFLGLAYRLYKRMQSEKS